MYIQSLFSINCLLISYFRPFSITDIKINRLQRIRSAERNHFGDCMAVEHGVSEMRIHFGPEQNPPGGPSANGKLCNR